MADARATVLPWPLEPDRVARASFSHSFRGFDPTEVRSFLARVAGELAALKAREAELTARVSELEHRRPVSPTNLDEQQVTELLGAEAARVLDAAREASTAIRVNAERHAGELLDEARAEADHQRSGAADFVEQRRSEAEEEATRVLDAAEHEADRLAEEAQATLEDARREADQHLEASREDGRRMVAEARAVRERILSDMARRRNHARQQLEKLRAGRERLLDAIEAVRSSAEQVGGELSGSLVEARLAGERAARQVDVETIPSLNELDAEVELAKDAGLIDLAAIERELAAASHEDHEDAAVAVDGHGTDAALGAEETVAPVAETEGGEPAEPEEASANELAWADDGGESGGDRQVNGHSTTPIVVWPAPLDGPDVGKPPTADGIAETPAPADGADVRGSDPKAAEPGGEVPAAVPEPGEGPPPDDGSAPIEGAGQVDGSESGGDGAEATSDSTASANGHTAGPEPTTEGGGGEDDGGENAADGADGAGIGGITPAGADQPASGGDDALTPASADEPVPPADDAPTSAVDGGPAPTAPAGRAARRRSEPSRPAAKGSPSSPAKGSPSRRETGTSTTRRKRAATAPVGGFGDAVDDVFSRLKHTGGAVEAPTPVAADADADAAAKADGAAVADAEPGPGDVAAPDAAGTTGTDDGSESGVPSGDRTLLHRRDAMLAGTTRDLVRQLKLALSNEQNVVLELARGARSGRIKIDDLPAGDEAAGRYRPVVQRELSAALQAGWQAALDSPATSGHGAATPDDAAPVEGTDLGVVVEELIAALTDPLRERLADLAAGETDQLEDQVRNLYRDTRNQRVAGLAEHATLAAFAAGQLAAVRKSGADRPAASGAGGSAGSAGPLGDPPAPTQVRWVFEACSPDCLDNSLAGPVPAGQPFPTGHLRPPAFPGCRCLLVAAGQTTPRGRVATTAV